MILVLLVFPVNLLADSGVGFNLEVSKELLIKYKSLLQYKEHNNKIIGLLQKQNDELKLTVKDLGLLETKYKEQVDILKAKILVSQDKFGACEDRAEAWKLEYDGCNKDLAKALKKPWYYIHLPSVGYGAILGLVLMVL